MKRSARWFAFVLAFLGLAGQGSMTEGFAGEAEIARLEQAFAADAPVEALFAESFLASVPANRLRDIFEDVRKSYGPVSAVRQDAGQYLVETPTHSIPVEIVLNSEGLIAGLMIRPAEPLSGSIEDTLSALTQLTGDVSYFVKDRNSRVFEKAAGTPMAVGSAFKLGVLKVLMHEIKAGTRNWDDVMRLKAQDRSLPSGQLHDFPEGSPLTLHSLAAAMIAASDNTATDMLIRLLGREKIALSLGLDTILTTRAFFQLKADPELAARYRSGEASEREAVMKVLEQRGAPGIRDVTGPYQEGIEWYVSVSRLCEVAEEVMDLDVFAINPGPVAKRDWSRVAFKGGSETGVLNLTAALDHAKGGTACISMTINASSPVDELKASGLFARLTRQLAEESQ